MKLIAELSILVIFFLAYYFFDMYIAIGVAMALYTVQLVVMLYLRKPISNMDKFTYFTVVVLGGLSLLFQNELFFKWKPSIVYCLLASGIVMTRIMTKTSAIQKLLGHVMSFPNRVWAQLDYAWSVFFLSLAGLNLCVAYLFSTDIWVYFKLFGTISLLIVFVLCQACWLSPHLKTGQPK